MAKRDVRFTRDFVEKLKYDPRGSETQIIWGTGRHRNLGVALSPAGAHSWIVRVHIAQANSRKRKRRIGRLFPGFTALEKSAEDAIRELEIWRGEAALGTDPMEKRRPSSTAPTEERQPSRPATIEDLLGRYRDEHVLIELRKATVRNFERSASYLVKHLGGIPLMEIDRSRLNTFRHALARIRPTFNLARKALAHACRLADRRAWMWEGRPMVPPGWNPGVLVDPYRDKAKSKGGKAFEPDEVAKIDALARREIAGTYSCRRSGQRASRPTLALPLFLLYTGMRKNEAMGLSWKNLDLPKDSGWSGWVDLSRRVAHVIHHKTSRWAGQKDVPLSAQALELVELMKGEDETWVFPGKQAGQRMLSFEHTWRRLQREAGIEIVRSPHNTRHTYVTAALEAGASLAGTGESVGHSTAYMTSQYGHISERAAREAADLASSRLRPSSPATEGAVPESE